jgi:hypothetical protein
MTFRFRVQPSSWASTYLRSVLGASGNLRDALERVKGRMPWFFAICARIVLSAFS